MRRTLQYSFPFYCFGITGTVHVFPAHAIVEYNGCTVSVDSLPQEITNAVFVARMQMHGQV